MRVDRRDLGAGLFFVAVGLLYFVYTLQTLTIGRALQMGPGYLPIVLSSIMTLIGVIVLVKAFTRANHMEIGKVPWRAVIMITASIVFFGFFLRELGMLPTVFATSMLACLSSEQIKTSTSLIVSAGMAVFCSIVFLYGVKLTIPLFGSWIM